jgi:hypothetical protein
MRKKNINHTPKTGIITFHWADNFGAVLQSYALSKQIETFGIASEIINFVPYELEKGYLFTFRIKEEIRNRGVLRTIRLFLSKIKNAHSINKRRRSFSDFRKRHLKIVPDVLRTVEELYINTLVYDYYIVGSDQVWNPDFFLQTGGAYFLSFADKNTKKIAYAASIANKQVEDYRNIFEKELKKFDYISIRENSDLEFIHKVCDKGAITVLDPTLLTDEKSWLGIATYNFSPGRFILVYDLFKDEELVKLANRIANEFDCKIISYTKNKGKVGRFINWMGSFESYGPSDFLGLFKKAEFVVTSSFHGTAFSVIFNKPFYTVPHPTRGSRMIDLLKDLELNDRLVVHNKDLEFIDVAIDYESVNEKLNVMRRKSIDFLSTALGNE